MDRLLDRLRINRSTRDSDETTSEEAVDSSGTVGWRDSSQSTNWDVGQPGSGETIEWRNISVRGDSESTPADQQSAGVAPFTLDGEEGLEAVGSEQLLTTVLDGLSTPTLIVDSSGHVAYLNDTACELFELAEPAAVDRPSTALHDGAPLVPRVLATGEPVYDHRETVTVGGSQYTLSRTVVPFRTEAGSVVGAMETIRGRTE